jgi:hypothetical protein
VHPIARHTLTIEAPLPSDISMLLDVSGLQSAWRARQTPPG